MKVGDLITRPMVQHTGHNRKSKIRQSCCIMTVEVDRPLPERAGGFMSPPEKLCRIVSEMRVSFAAVSIFVLVRPDWADNAK